MTEKKKRNRWVTNLALLCLLLIPGFFWAVAANMTVSRYDSRQIAVKITGEVIDQQEIHETCKDSDGRTRTCTHWTYRVRFNVFGEQVERQLLDARFDPNYTEHTDGIDHEAQPVGSNMALLLRQDLNNAVAPDSFWSAYLMPVIMAVFGGFVCIMMIICIVLGWEGPRAPVAKSTVTRT